MIFCSNKNRPFHYGPYGLERLPHDTAMVKVEMERERADRPNLPDPVEGFSKTVADYHAIFGGFRQDEPAAASGLTLYISMGLVVALGRISH